MILYRFDNVRRRVKYFAFAVAIAATAILFCGCGSDASISLNASAVFMTVGESRDFLPYVDFSDFEADKDISLASSDDGILKVNGHIVTALKKGETLVTLSAYGKELILPVSVGYMQSGGIRIEASERYQNITTGETPKPVKFSASLDSHADPDIEIVWTVNGDEAGRGGEFEFLPEGVGEYIVGATGDGVEDHTRVAVYMNSDVTVSVSGKLDQTDGDFSPIKLVARERINTLNPSSVYEWTVNGAPAGYGMSFEFTPEKSGDYEIALAVNGKARSILSKPSLTVTAAGERAPKGELVFDDTGGVYAKWRDGGYIVRATVYCPDGRRINIDRSDAQNAYRFERGALKLDGIVDACGDPVGTYRIELVAEGKTEFSFTRYPEAARRFLDEKVLCRNGFITDAAEAKLWVSELYACGLTHARCYLSREAVGIESAVRRAASDLGLTVVTAIDGQILSADIADYINAPSATEAAGEAVRMYAELPHIEYDQRYLRGKNFVLPIDRKRGGVEVKNTEALLRVALEGERPIALENSDARGVYNAARNVLLNIIAHDHDDAQKAHAIYDWLQWTTVRSHTEDKKSAARFLEGTFGSASLGGSVAVQPAVTSEGMAKAFALMCRMEGLDCDILYTKKNGEPYFCNSLTIDGAQYYIDVYGGEIDSGELGISRKSELTSHRGLFMSSGYASSLGIDTTLAPLDAFCDGLSVYLEKKYYGGVYYDKFIQKEDIGSGVIKAAVYDAFASLPSGSVSIVTVGSVATFPNITLGAEFRIDGLLDIEHDGSALAKVIDEVRSAAQSYALSAYGKRFPDGAIAVYVCGNVFHLAATVLTQ